MIYAIYLTNVVESILDHGGTLQSKTPSNDTDIRVQAHSLQHLRTEHARVSKLDPLLKTRVPRENFHTWLGIRVESRLEFDVGHTHLLEEDLHESNQITQSQVLVRDDSLDLVELGQMSGIDGFVTVNTIDREEFGGLEHSSVSLGLLRKAVKHVGGNGGGVGAEKKLLSLLNLPIISVSNRSISSMRVNLLDAVHIVHVGEVGGSGRIYK